ncbi:hypothetical protein TRIUR3_31212 [Triticum urartu]|uniref:Uncharacterized protein n=1 Tax=Triticum urartu TaxID=4572 RepID=M8AA90_TRIUA|nr:hypothetical protein TRIUR3_31212 [Triticum urartu]
MEELDRGITRQCVRNQDDKRHGSPSRTQPWAAAEPEVDEGQRVVEAVGEEGYSGRWRMATVVACCGRRPMAASSCSSSTKMLQLNSYGRDKNAA